jgi:hypothetical protein
VPLNSNAEWKEMQKYVRDNEIEQKSIYSDVCVAKSTIFCPSQRGMTGHHFKTSADEMQQEIAFSYRRDGRVG